MNIENIKEIFKPGTVGYLATKNGQQLELRGWQFQYAEGNRFYFATANIKNVYTQIISDPNVAFSGVSEGYNIRLSGKAVFIRDAVEKAEAFLNIANAVKEKYQSASNTIFELFYIENGEFKINKGTDPIEVIKF